MAIVFVITVYSILIVIYESAADQYQIEKSLCLETAVVFINGRQKCDFNKSNAQHSLENDITFGSGIHHINPCPNRKGYNMLTMFINCSMWNAGK